MMRRSYASEAPERLRTMTTTRAYTKYAVRYPSGELTISGVLYVPRGGGPFPGIVLNHGYIEPSRYVTGQGMPREQAFLAEQGFVVLHTDYRGHAGSSSSGQVDRELHLGYAEDALNAAQALKAMPEVDAGKVAMFVRHGTADSTCPIEWSRRSHALMLEADVDVRLIEREGEEHTYHRLWSAAMADTHAFLRQQLRI